MKKSKMTFYLLLLITISVLLVGCKSEEAKEVINSINELGEITLDSFSSLQLVNAKYASLSDKDKADISNYNILEEANDKFTELKCDDISNRIDIACANVTAESLDELTNIYNEYEELSEEWKEHILNISKLEEAIESSKTEKAKQIEANIIEESKTSPSRAQTMLEENYATLTEQQINDCLISIGRWGSVEKAETHLKKYLKDPNSYTRYSGTCSFPSFQINGTYKTELNLDYGAKNSFGGMVRDDVKIFVYFVVNLDSLSVEYTKTELSDYYKMKYS